MDRRWAVAVGIWIAWILVAVIVAVVGGDDALHAFGLLGFVVLLVAVPRVAILEGRKWYEVVGLLVPIVNLILVGRVIWYIAGRVVGAPRPSVVSTLNPEEARRKLAEDAAEAVRAAEERTGNH